MPEMRQVFSENVHSIGHDADTGELHVAWNSGRTSVYAGVPPDVASEVMRAPSVTSAINDMIKPNYGHRYL